MPFITAIVSAIAAIGSFVVGGAGLGALTIGGISAGTLGSVGLAVGLSALNYALTPKNKASIGRVNDPGTRGNVRQAVPPQRFPYGTVQVGGAVFFLDDSKPPALYLGLLLSARPINGVVSVKLGTDIVTFDEDMKALNAPYREGVDCFLRGSFRLGASDQAIDPLLDEVFTNLDAEFRQRGSATAVFEFTYGDDREHFEELWGQVQIPNPFVLIEGALVYDPRDPTQLLDDATTWKWSDNATLIQADWAKHADGVGEDPADADWDRIAESANYDDEIVQLPDGSFQKRHTINGIVTLDQSPRDIMEALLTANRGSLRRSKGTWWIESSKPRDPIVTLTDRDIIGAFEYRDSSPTKDRYNKVRGRFTAPERDYQEADGPIIHDEDLEDADGELLETTIRAPFTDNHYKLQRLQYQFLLESRLGKLWSGPASLRLLGIDVEDAIRIDSEIWPMINGVYKVSNWGFLDDFSGLRLELREYDRTISIAEPSYQEFELPELDVT